MLPDETGKMGGLWFRNDELCLQNIGKVLLQRLWRSPFSRRHSSCAKSVCRRARAETAQWEWLAVEISVPPSTGKKLCGQSLSGGLHPTSPRTKNRSGCQLHCGNIPVRFPAVRVGRPKCRARCQVPAGWHVSAAAVFLLDGTRRYIACGIMVRCRVVVISSRLIGLAI